MVKAVRKKRLSGVLSFNPTGQSSSHASACTTSITRNR